MKPGRVAFANTAEINLSHCYTAIKAAHKERLLWIIPRLSMPNRVGGGVASPVLSHHRANGSVPRRFLSPIIGLSFVPLNSLACVL